MSNWISYQLRDGPTKIAYYWNVLPPDVDFIDAAVERPDSLIYIFRGNMTCCFLFSGYPNCIWDRACFSRRKVRMMSGSGSSFGRGGK